MKDSKKCLKKNFNPLATLKTICYGHFIMKAYMTYDKRQNPFPIPAFLAVTSAIVLFLLFLNGCGSAPAPEKDPLTEIKKTLAKETTYSVVLEDMKEEGTFSKSHFHKYLVVLPEDSWQTDWTPVSEEYYNKSLELMGMTILTKKDGVYDNVAAPPGYGFVGDPNYGQWKEGSNGSSFWEFYGKYALISNLFGGWYHPIYRTDFDGYHKYKQSKKPYFGSKNQYGSSGHIVKQKKPNFYASRMNSVNKQKSDFTNKVNSKIGRTKTSMRSRSGGKGK